MINVINQLELHHIKSFMALADALHFGKAAENLHISQSALSQQIKQLEAIVGTRLFNRTNRTVSLNRAGNLFLREARLMDAQIKRSLERWQLELNGHEGEVHIGFVGSAMQLYMPPLLKKFGKEYPKIRLHLEELTNEEQLQALDKGDLDIGFMRSNQIAHSMNIKSVYEENFSLVLPNGHPITQENFKNLGQLAQERFILFPNEKSPLYYQQILNMCAFHGFVPQISHRSIHGPTIFMLVENGMGVSIVPNSLRDEHNCNIRFIELVNIKQKTNLFAVWNKTNDNAAFQNFLPML